eukprot:104556_1
MGSCASCSCMHCFMDSYLHLRIRNITNAHWKGAGFDDELTGFDLCITVKYQGYQQDSKIVSNERGSIVFCEPIIIENGTPPEPGDELRLIVYEVDHHSADDFLGEAIVKVPLRYGNELANSSEQTCDVRRGNEVVARITVDQLHFIKQKVRRYKGPCKCLCCCFHIGYDGCGKCCCYDFESEQHGDKHEYQSVVQ